MNQPQLAQPELTKLQRQVLQVFKNLESKENVTAVARQLKIEPALAKNLLTQLTDLHLLRLTFEGAAQYYVMQQAAVDYLCQLANGDIAVPGEPAGILYSEARNLVSQAGSYGVSASTIAENLSLDHKEALQLLLHLKEQGFVNRWGQGRFFVPAAQRKAAKAVDVIPEQASDTTEQQAKSTLPAGQLQDERLKALKKALGELEEKIQFPPKILIPDYELKQEVLQRLAQFFDDSISSVLTDIRTDLQHIHTFNSGVQQ
ncbi:hypothetical protein [Rheinheimera gaetbuli]